MIRKLLAASGLIFALAPAAAMADPVDDALTDAIAAFARAAPQMGATSQGVDVAAYAAALGTGRFTSPFWGMPLALDIHASAETSGSCGRFAAFVSLPPQDGSVRLTLCPQFSSEGTPALRRLTVLHEMVHVVAGPDECRAMAFAARVEQLATGSFTPVDRYWQANGCEGSEFSLP